MWRHLAAAGGTNIAAGGHSPAALLLISTINTAHGVLISDEVLCECFLLWFASVFKYCKSKTKMDFVMERNNGI